jgi:hypothetical protein
VPACTREPSREDIARKREDHRYRRSHTGLPCAVVYGLYELSPVNLRLPPSSARCVSIVANFSACMCAPGPHDFAVRDLRFSSASAFASTASRLARRDDRDAPLLPLAEAGRRGE